MSYILDALRKSEDERTQQDKVRRESMRGSSYHADRSMSLLPWMLLLLLFSLALAAWWFWPTLTNIVAQARDNTNAKPAALTTSQNDANAQQLGSGVASSLGAESNNDGGANRSTTNGAAVSNSTINSSTISISTTGRADKEFLNADAALPPGNKLKELWQMPIDFQARIPDMNFSFHVYSDKPSSRTIIINGRRLKEGAMVTSKIKLRMISATGVILHAHGRFFHVDAYEQMYVPTGN